MSRERAVAAGLALADRAGLTGLTMRALAAELGVPVMNLYHYVANKDDLLDAISDLALAEVESPQADAPWDRRIAELMCSFRAVLLRHPSLGQLFADRPVSGPNTFRAADAALAVMLDAGLPPAGAVDAFTALITYTIGASLFETARSGDRSPEAAERVRLERLDAADASELPALAAAAPHLRVRGTEAQFQYGLERLLEGIRRSAA